MYGNIIKSSIKKIQSVPKRYGIASYETIPYLLINLEHYNSDERDI